MGASAIKPGQPSQITLTFPVFQMCLPHNFLMKIMIQTVLNIGHPFLYLVVLIFIAITNVSARCPSDEYSIMHQECCPACRPGYHVSEDCIPSIKYTVCLPCSDGTFNNDLNGLKQCSPCTECSPGLGLKVKKQCTTTSDALCEVLDGYFCKDSKGGGCMTAQKHMDCSPGQYISQRGTASEDTVCIQCIDGTFSDGNSTSCLPHTRCDSKGQKQIKPGTESSDSECGEPSKPLLWLASIPIILPIPGFIIFWFCFKKKKELKASAQELMGWLFRPTFNEVPNRDEQQTPQT